LNNRLRVSSNYQFFDHFELNMELLDHLEKIKSRLPIYMFTMETIQGSPEIREQIQEVFSKVFSAMKMGVEKSDPESYKIIARDLGVDPSEIFYTDDKKENVDAAKSAGCRAVQFENNGQLISELQKI